MQVARTLRTTVLLLAFLTQHMLAAGQAVALYAPRLPYSPSWPDGDGVFILHLDAKTGTVGSVSVAKSTGVVKLDQAAIAGLKRWRFRPGPKLVRIPLNFTHRPLSQVVHSSPRHQ